MRPRPLAPTAGCFRSARLTALYSPAAIAAITLFAAPAPAGPPAWTQWGGPNGNFCVESTGLADEWPEGGPKQLWKRELGGGHSAILADGDTLYTLYRRGEQDVAIALKADSGETIWETAYDAPPKKDMDVTFGPGPHSTPLLAGGRLYTLSATALLHCLDARTGDVLWSHDLMDEYGASHLGRGYGASPVAYKNTVIVSIGGSQGGLAAFDQKSGELRWKTGRLPGGYPTPLLCELAGREQLVVAAGAERAGFDPADGSELWRMTLDPKTAAIMSTPLAVGPDRVFFSAAYGVGSDLVKVERDGDKFKAESLWHSNKMRVQHGSMVPLKGIVIGSSGDFGPAFLMALRLEDGEMAWRERGIPKATVLLAGDKLIIHDEDGGLTLARPTEDALNAGSKHRLFQPAERKSWTVPTLVGTRLYARDHYHITALDLGARASG